MRAPTMLAAACALAALGGAGRAWSQTTPGPASPQAPRAAREDAARGDAARGGVDERTRQRPKLDRRDRELAERYEEDEKGRRFRVAFPLYDRLSLEGNTGLAPVGRGRGPTQPGGRARLNLSLSLDFSEEEVWWVMRHTVLDATASPTGQAGVWRLRGVGLNANYLRHDLSSFILVPSLNDFRLPADFDIAVDYRLGFVDATFGPGQPFQLRRLEVLDLAFLADLLRDDDYRRRLAVGLATWYHTSPGQPWRHELSPSTGVKLIAGWDQARGLFRAYAETICGAALHFDAASPGNQWRWRCRANGVLEWTPLTISDTPLSLPLEVHVDVPLASPDQLDVFATLGLRWSVPLD